MFETDRQIAAARKRYLSARGKWRRGTVDDTALADAAHDLACAYLDRYERWPLVCGYGTLCKRKAQEYAVLAGALRDGRVSR